ncbi:hypothetical protein DPMN_001859 [Dreissena polymorpha]|uniref:Uncharacterized protein n=1 Tax=Dreissena polymorpha TaxID=45954 RepID=A0A9D4RTA3_DREPO|nr:hypothetical protein DPMN_001859 [Dreissena polymorpha]
MPKVQCGVSVPPLPVKVSPKVTQSDDETWQTCLARWATHAKSAMWRLSATASGESVAEGDPERRNLADLFGPMGHACQKCNVASQCHRFRCESVAEGDPERRNLADLFGPMGHACQKCNVASQCHRFRSLKSRLSLGTCLARWATHAKSAMWRLSATASGESVAEGTLTGPSLKSRLSLGVGDPERRNLADLFGPMGHACQSAMWRLSATASGESVAEGDPERRNLADLFGPMGHACQKCNVASQCHRFRCESVAEGDPERRNLADLFGPMGHACQKCNVASQCHRFR